MLYTLRFFSSKCSLFHNVNLFGSCIIHILYTGCAKIKKKYISGAKVLMTPRKYFVCNTVLASFFYGHQHSFVTTTITRDILVCATSDLMFGCDNNIKMK